MSLLNNLPIGSKSAPPLIDDYVKIEIVFLPLAKRHCDTHGAAWPADLINAAANSLATLIGDANAQQFRQLQHKTTCPQKYITLLRLRPFAVKSVIA